MSDEIKIDKGIPIPEIDRNLGGKMLERKYPFDEMHVGDSFLVKDRTISRVNSCVSWWNSKPGMKRWITRRCTNGVRVWRIQ